MNLRLIVPLTIEMDALDYDTGLLPSEEEESRMRESAKEAIENALARARDMGFNHEMEDITAIRYGEIEVMDTA